MTNQTNIDRATVRSFGSEWSVYDQSSLSEDEHRNLFDAYFHLFPFEKLPVGSEGIDIGCGSGRWAKLVAPRVGRLNCIDPSPQALEVTRRNLSGANNVAFYEASADTVPLAAGSQDFGYSLGVLHHIPDTPAALAACTRLLKPRAPFLLYLYYSFDNRPSWFRALWKASEILRNMGNRLPDGIKPVFTDLLAAVLYWPLARFAKLIEKLGARPNSLPLSYYREKSFYTMRTDSRDRFGTPLEQRFTRAEMAAMMEASGLCNIRFSEDEPYWVAIGYRV